VAYIISLVALAALFLAMHYFTELTKKHKISIIVILFIFIYAAITYNTYKNEQSKKILENVKKFNQNKTLKCGNIDVNKTNFTLSVGTFTFIGKKNTPYFEEMISVSTCQ
jgi:uncharacterized Rmd1/YagE family protein